MGVITTAVMVGATLVSGMAKYQQGRAAQDVAKDKARAAIAKGNIEKFQQKQESESVRKRATAQAGKGGGSLSGSYLENLNASMTNAQLDYEMINYNAQVMSNNYIQEGRNARAEGTSALLSSVASAASMGMGAFGGAENMAGQGSGFKLGDVPSVKPTR